MFLEEAWINTQTFLLVVSANILKRGYISAPSQPASQAWIQKSWTEKLSQVRVVDWSRCKIQIHKQVHKYTKHEYLSTSQAWMLNWENFRFVNSWWGLLHLIFPQCLFDFVWTEKCLEVKFVDWSRCWTQTWLLPGLPCGEYKHPSTTFPKDPQINEKSMMDV